MNSRQRRGIILVLLSVLAALGAFVGVLSVISDVESKVGPEQTAYKLKTDVQAYEPLEPGQFERTRIPERWLPDTAVTDLSDLAGKVATTTLHKGSLLQRDMVAARPALRPGQQEIAIMIDASTGVAGKIRPGATVNIFATFQGEGDKEKSTSKLIVANAPVIDVGKLTPFQRTGDNDPRRDEGDAVPITFALSTQDAQRLAYAESFAAHVRLALVAPGSTTEVAPGDRTYTLDEDG
ncbi:Flp pilus assembly protein CpaB [Streptomyces sp. NPDC051940]|uniref:Flp pilus assembly protein CpaB n=1 Tax=Streptomyces sp. NPDC051940 TaxID=3155675 RepID=UPI003436B5E3